MGWVQVGTTTIGGTGGVSGARTIIYSRTVSAGNSLFIVGGLSNANSGITLTSIVDSSGDTWTTDVFLDGAGGIIEILRLVGYCSSSGSRTVTVTYNAAAAVPSNDAPMLEFMGGALSPLDSAPATTSGTGTAVTGPSPTQSAGGNDLFFGVAAVASNSAGPNSPGGGFTQIIRGSAILISTDALSHTPTWTNSSSIAWVAGAASYKPVPLPPTGHRQSNVAVMRASNWMESAKGLLIPERRRFWSPQLVLAR